MRLKVLSSLLLLFFPAWPLAAQTTSNAQKFSPPTRTFRFTYNFTVKDIPSGAKRVRVWIPVPQTDQHQTVRVLAVKAPVKTRMMQEPEYGNHMMYAEINNPAPGTADTLMELLDRDGTTVLETDNEDGSLTDDASSIAGATLPGTGTYFIRLTQGAPPNAQPVSQAR